MSTPTRLIRYSAMTEAQKKEVDKKRSAENKQLIDAKYKVLEATSKRRVTRIVHCNQKIDEKKRSIQGFERVMRKKHSDKTYAFIKTELHAAQKALSEMKTHLSELRKAFDCAENDLQSFLKKTFGSPVRGETCIRDGESRTVLQYGRGKYVFVEVKKYKH
jgi:hypothetical protein